MRVKRIGEHNLPLPSQHHMGDAGFDLQSTSKLILFAGERQLIGTGFAWEIPDGMVGVIKDRSGMGLKGIHVLGGVVDSTYRGEVKVILQNLSESHEQINVHDKIAQMIITNYLESVLEEVDELANTVRGDGGFGSTGR